MQVDDAKEYAINVCHHWLILEMNNIRRSLPSSMTLMHWKCRSLASGIIDMSIRCEDSGDFWDWAKQHWVWKGVYNVHLVWLTRQRFPDDEDWTDLRVERVNGETKVSDERYRD